jgi:hypothetical protein
MGRVTVIWGELWLRVTCWCLRINTDILSRDEVFEVTYVVLMVVAIQCAAEEPLLL